MVKVVLGVKRALATVAVLIACVVAVSPMAGCDRTKQAMRNVTTPPEGYVPHQQFGGDGQACMNGRCPVINQPKQWLKPCR